MFAVVENVCAHMIAGSIANEHAILGVGGSFCTACAAGWRTWENAAGCDDEDDADDDGGDDVDADVEAGDDCTIAIAAATAFLILVIAASCPGEPLLLTCCDSRGTSSSLLLLCGEPSSIDASDSDDSLSERRSKYWNCLSLGSAFLGNGALSSPELTFLCRLELRRTWPASVLSAGRDLGVSTWGIRFRGCCRS